MQLYKGCSEFADFTNYISYDWKDVQQKLSPKDVAVEFAVVGTSAFDDENVIKALVLTSEMSQPVALTVCTLTEAKSMQNNERLFDSANSTIWNKLKPYLMVSNGCSSRQTAFSISLPLNISRTKANLCQNKWKCIDFRRQKNSATVIRRSLRPTPYSLAT